MSITIETIHYDRVLSAHEVAVHRRWFEAKYRTREYTADDAIRRRTDDPAWRAEMRAKKEQR